MNFQREEGVIGAEESKKKTYREWGMTFIYFSKLKIQK